MAVLTGDVGGTKTHLCWARSPSEILAERRYDSQAYRGLGEILQEFCQEFAVTATVAVLGIAGPVRRQCSHLTNLGWDLVGETLAQTLGMPVHLLNDLEAAAYGVLTLTPPEWVVLQEGTPELQAPIALVGAGTGLGTGYLTWQGDRYRAYPAEGGHLSLAPQTDAEIELLRYLRSRHGRVSGERVVSGAGLTNLYTFLQAQAGQSETPLPPAAIQARAPQDDLAHQALVWFTRYYGRIAGDLALALLPRGGVYLTGGIPPKMLPWLTDGTFLNGFLDKGRLREVLTEIPVRVVLAENVGLRGAIAYAQGLDLG
ncbi:MAG TPA: glucokinase [Cyanobacteria bacterium UBA8156]|jgi:glucokinase|nr:glucokinase [Cyanobacteria bacterium UBA8156]